MSLHVLYFVIGIYKKSPIIFWEESKVLEYFYVNGAELGLKSNEGGRDEDWTDQFLLVARVIAKILKAH